MSRVPKGPLVLGALLVGCHRSYDIEGKVIVARGVPNVSMPALLCVGRGGPLETSGVYGHPANATNDRSEGNIFCGPAPREFEVPLRESIYYGSLPRRAHVYAWFVPVPAATKLCAERAVPIVQVDFMALDRLMSPADADKPSNERAPASYPCGRNPTSDMPMAFTVTFDPDHKTRSESGPTWVEERYLRIDTNAFSTRDEASPR